MHTNIQDAINECGPGHPAHVNNPRNDRIVAIRTGNEPDTFNLDFSDPKIDLRQEDNGGTLYNIPADRVQKTIALFLSGERVSDRDRFYQAFINQATREAEVERLTPTRARISYYLPRSGYTKSWRYQVTIGRYSYIGSY